MNRDILHITLILEAISEIEGYVADNGREEFLRNSLVKNASLMMLIRVGENGGKVSGELRSKFSEIEWQQMKAARNFFVHEYDRIDWPRVWDMINEILPGLKIKLEKILKSLND